MTNPDSHLHAVPGGQDIDIKTFKDIVSYFPIGERMSYYPEYQSDMTMQTIVLGYEINGNYVYTQNQIEILLSSGKGYVTLHMQDKEYQYNKLQSFCLLVPGNAGEEYKLNFISKASLGNRGQFRNGNSITLVARFEGRGVATLETSVRESMMMKEGYFRGHRLVSLEMVNASLDFAEQRSHHRLQTSIPVKLQTAGTNTPIDVLLRDYSEQHMQIKFDDDGTRPKVNKGDTIGIAIKLESLHKTFILKCQVVRSEQGHILVTMRQISDAGTYRDFELMDALDLKSCLLQHPNTL